ncbi:nucleotide disphospho-sugar-binding domain-containing protein [Streptomyces chattanoogensis]
MRVLFAVSNWPGHWASMVPLGWALQAAGHEVHVMCTPCQTQPVSGAGLMPVPILEAMDMTVRGRLHNFRMAEFGSWPFSELPLHPLTGEPLDSLDEFDMSAWSQENHDWAIGVTTRSSDAAVEFARWWRPDLVVHDIMSFEGPLVGKVLDIPAVLQLWGPVGPDDDVPGAPPGASFVPVDPSGAFPRHGVGQMGPHVYEHVIDPSPSSARPPLKAERLPIRHVPYNGPGARLPHGESGSAGPRVCVVWGTSVSGIYGPASFAVPRVVNALAGLGAEVLVLLADADRARMERAGALPPGVRLMERTPLHLLMPSCDVVIHHGGAGCAMTALTAGVPQLAIHTGLDQEVIAGRIAGAGAARSLSNVQADEGAIRAAVTSLLTDPAHAIAARKLRDEMESQPTPAALVSSLSALAQ